MQDGIHAQDALLIYSGQEDAQVPREGMDEGEMTRMIVSSHPMPELAHGQRNTTLKDGPMLCIHNAVNASSIPTSSLHIGEV